MKVIADAHAHVYPCYDASASIAAAWRNLNELAAGAGPEPAAGGDVLLAVFLTERCDCHFFRDLRDGAVRPGGFRVGAVSEEGALALFPADGGRPLYVFAGRQVATRERLEALVLTADLDAADGQPFEAVADVARAAGAPAVLPWSPGKWLGARGRLVARIMAKTPPDDLLIGDTALRPQGWREPALMRQARENGFRVVAGTDPLPFAGEERRIGTYGAILDAGAFDAAQPVTSVRRALRQKGTALRSVGRRCGWWGVARRLLRHRMGQS
jgi:hypothetical protein